MTKEINDFQMSHLSVDLKREPMQKAHAMACEVAEGDVPIEFPTNTIKLIKAREPEQRFVLGIVLEPEVVDAQDDIYSAEEIQKAAWKFMEEQRNLGVMHRHLDNEGLVILENYISLVDMKIGKQTVKKGTWLLGMRVKSDRIWAMVKNGDFTGLSIGGAAIRTPDPA